MSPYEWALLAFVFSVGGYSNTRFFSVAAVWSEVLKWRCDVKVYDLSGYYCEIIAY